MNNIKKITCLIVLVFLSSCIQKEKQTTILIKNALDVDRAFETVELSKSILKLEDLSNIGIRNSETQELQITQLVDKDGDGSMDVVLFQPEIKANAEAIYEIVTVSETEKPKAPELCYSRFVPERTDDYTWENNKVAFRVYGPTAQKLAEKGDPNGTLSSGVDIWLKKVEYPVINKWYKEFTDGTGTYHEDTGEGLDNVHVDRPLLPEHDLTDKKFMIVANKKMHIEILVKDGYTSYTRDGVVIFEIKDPEPYTSGYFGFRTVNNHMEIENFKVIQLK